MPWQGVDKRLFPRANYPCVVKLREKGNPEIFNTQTENIGCGGVCVMLPKHIEMFHDVQMEIDMVSEARKINCDGTVVWVVHRQELKKNAPDSFDTGIEFKNLKQDDKLVIEKVVQECLKKNKS
jgi:Tfp pilus assembly protein PilZ